MTPGNGQGRPGEGDLVNPAVADLKFASTLASQAEVEPRAGEIVRATFERSAAGTCTVCGRRFDATGPAASHAGATRHTVTCSYATRFSFVPVETLDGDPR